MNNMQLTIESSTTSMDLNDHQTGIYLVPELDGMTGLPEIRTSSGVNAGYDGGWTSAQNYDARLITIRGVIAHPVVSTVETIRRQLVSLVGQGRKEALTLRLTTEAGNVYTVFVRTIACTMALQRVLTSQEFQIQFRADDPLIYDDGASSGTAGILRVQRALGGFEINFNLPLFIGGGSTGTPIENGGSETVYPIINLYGPLHSPTVINSTTNQQMQILADLAYENNWQTPATASGSSFQITGIEGAPLTLTELKGNATQNGTPTPDAPVAVNTTTGENVVKITGKNLQPVFANATISLAQIMTAGSLSLQQFYTGYSESLTATNGALVIEPSGTSIWKIIISGLDAETTYTLSADYSVTLSQNGNIFVLGHFLTNLSGGTAHTGRQSLTFTTDADGNWQSTNATAQTLVYAYNYTTIVTMSNIQLELGSTATTYEPYQEGQEYTINLGNIELAKIGTYQDRIYKNDGKWYVEKQTGKVVLNGSETWNLHSNSNETTALFMLSSGLSDALSVLATSTDYLRNDRFNIYNCYGSSNTNEGLCYHTDRKVQIRINKSRLATVDVATFQTWLASNPTTVYYALATPTTTEITNTTLLSQLNFIANLYGGTNNIMLVGTGAQGEIGVEYMTENDIRRDVAVVDSQARTITINGSDAYHLKADGSEFITIAPGTNDMTLTSAQTSDEGYAEIKYKQGYLSI